VKIALRLKATLLLLLLAVSILPLRLFCVEDDSHSHATLSIDVQSDHHDCPFCSIQFYHEFEEQRGFSFSVNCTFSELNNEFSLGKPNHFSVSSKNKGPPSLFI
jgi:hypothetical protein